MPPFPRLSIKTVSRVVNDEPGVRLSTKKRVDNAIAELEYSPDQAAQMLARTRSQKAT